MCRHNGTPYQERVGIWPEDPCVIRPGHPTLGHYRKACLAEPGCQPHGSAKIRRECPEIAIVDPDKAGAGRQDQRYLVERMHLHEWFKSICEGKIYHVPQAVPEHAGNEKDGVGSECPALCKLPFVDDEVFPEQREIDVRSYRRDKRRIAMEIDRFGQYGEGGGTGTGKVPGECHRITLCSYCPGRW